MTEETRPGWNLMASHGVVLFYIAANPSSTMREMSETLGLTERRISRIVKDLAEAEMLRVTRIGRRNSYTVNRDAFFIHPTLSHIKLSVFVDTINDPAPAKPVTGQAVKGLLLGLLVPMELAGGALPLSLSMI